MAEPIFDVNLQVSSELKKAFANLDAVSSQNWPKILTRAINQTGNYVLNGYKSDLPKFFKNPTPFTVNSMYLKLATPQDLSASVQWKSPSKGNSAGHYLQPDVYGGLRPFKGLETALQRAGLMPKGYYCVPSADLPLDQYGNVKGTLVRTVLQYLQANPQAVDQRRIQSYQRQGTLKFLGGFAKTNANFERKQKAEARANAKKSLYFTVQPNDPNTHLSIGIYQRTGDKKVAQLFAFVPHVSYHSIFDFDGIGAQRANASFADKLNESIAANLLNRLQNV